VQASAVPQVEACLISVCAHAREDVDAAANKLRTMEGISTAAPSRDFAPGYY
jgi:hypothetical protein